MRVLEVLSLVAAVASAAHVLHEKREVGHAQWTKRSRLEPDRILPMRIGLTQSNLEKGHDYLMDV